jgi:hypothetical protein
MTLRDAYSLYLAKYDTPHNDFHVNLIRIFVTLFFAWKTMSRDFGFMGVVPTDFFYFYPIELYRPGDIMLITGIPGLMELVTFHWIHWITGFPSERMLDLLQFTLTGLAILTAIFGRGPRRMLAIATYVLASYLWGFIFLSGQDIDAVMLYFGMLLMLCLVSYRDVPTWRLGEALRAPDNVEAGRAFSAILLVFVLYYGLSGYNKIADLSITEWFRYQLTQDINHTLRMQSLGSYIGAPFPKLFGLIRHQDWLNYLLVPAVYISHLSVFVIFFSRKQILKFAVFYTGFHFVAYAVTIAFTGYVFIWWILLDWHKILMKLSRREAVLVSS